MIKYLVKNDYLSLLNFLRCDLVNISADSLKHLVKERENIENWLLDYSSEIDLNAEEREVLEIVKELKDRYNANDGRDIFFTYDYSSKIRGYSRDSLVREIFQICTLFIRLLKVIDILRNF